jgi:hypothetical protein
LTHAVGCTGFAKALPLAAWQFLVKRPRIDNKPQLGVWVRIHFDFGVRAVEAVEPADQRRTALSMLLTAYNFDCIYRWHGTLLKMKK